MERREAHEKLKHFHMARAEGLTALELGCLHVVASYGFGVQIDFAVAVLWIAISGFCHRKAINWKPMRKFMA